MVCALILIDIQKGFASPIWGARNNPGAEANAARLLQHWRGNGWPLFHIRHLSTTQGSPLADGQDGAEIMDIVKPLNDETVISKTVNSAFIGTDLEAQLRKRAITDLVICGLTTPHCVSTTTRMAGNLGFTVRLAHDACATFESNADSTWNADATPPSSQQIHDAAIHQLHGEFCTALSTDAILEAGA